MSDSPAETMPSPPEPAMPIIRSSTIKMDRKMSWEPSVIGQKPEKLPPKTTGSSG
jgi:hypothetical protein